MSCPATHELATGTPIHATGFGHHRGEQGTKRAGYLLGPLEPILMISLVLVLIALTMWFFAFAENPPRLVI